MSHSLGNACPAGFHPQLGWPTQCRNCFRSIGEHGSAQPSRSTPRSGSVQSTRSGAAPRSGASVSSQPTRSGSSIHGADAQRTMDQYGTLPRQRKKVSQAPCFDPPLTERSIDRPAGDSHKMRAYYDTMSIDSSLQSLEKTRQQTHRDLMRLQSSTRSLPVTRRGSPDRSLPVTRRGSPERRRREADARFDPSVRRRIRSESLENVNSNGGGSVNRRRKHEPNDSRSTEANQRMSWTEEEDWRQGLPTRQRRIMTSTTRSTLGRLRRYPMSSPTSPLLRSPSTSKTPSPTSSRRSSIDMDKPERGYVVGSRRTRYSSESSTSQKDVPVIPSNCWAYSGSQEQRESNPIASTLSNYYYSTVKSLPRGFSLRRNQNNDDSGHGDLGSRPSPPYSQEGGYVASPIPSNQSPPPEPIRTNEIERLASPLRIPLRSNAAPFIKSPSASIKTYDSGHYSDEEERAAKPGIRPPLNPKEASTTEMETFLRSCRTKEMDESPHKMESIPSDAIPAEARDEPPSAVQDEVIRRQAIVVEGLRLETEELRERIKEFEDEFDGNASMGSESESRLCELASRLDESEGACLELLHENIEMRNEIEELEAEIEEVQDHFRERDEREFKKMQHELDVLMKTCRNYQLKLRKAQLKSNELKCQNAELATAVVGRETDLWRSTAIWCCILVAGYQIIKRL